MICFFSNNAHYEASEYSTALHVMELTRRLKEEGVNITADCLHLGVIATNLAERGGYTGISQPLSYLVFTPPTQYDVRN